MVVELPNRIVILSEGTRGLIVSAESKDLLFAFAVVCS